jgi:hypothetical protein
MNTFDFTNNNTHTHTKRKSHTYRRNVAQFNPNARKLYTRSHVNVYPDQHYNSIAVTSLDADLGYNSHVDLNKYNRDKWVINKLERMACSKTARVNKLANQTITDYRVPASAFRHKTNTNVKRAKFNPQTQFMQNTNSIQSVQSMQPVQNTNVDVIGGKKYSNERDYYQSGSKFRKLKVHSIGKVTTIKPEVSSNAFVKYQVVTQHTPYNRVPNNYHHNWKDIRYRKHNYKDKLYNKFQRMKKFTYYPHDGYDTSCKL